MDSMGGSVGAVSRTTGEAISYGLGIAIRAHFIDGSGFSTWVLASGA